MRPVGREGGKAGGGAVVQRSALLAFGLALMATPLAAQDTTGVRLAHDSVAVRFIEADLRMVIQGLAQYLPKSLMTANVPAVRVTLETPHPVPRDGVAALLRGLVEAQGLALTDEGAFYRVAPKPPEPPPQAVPVAAAAKPQGGAVELRVIRLKHARAADVAATVNLLFGGSGEFSGGQGMPGTLSDELRRDNVRPSAITPDRPSALPTSRPSASFTGSVTIVPDERTNALLVRASPEDFAVLSQAVDELDIRPLQVLIEVLIIEARRDRGFSLSTDLFKPAVSGHQPSTTEGRVQQGSSGLSEMVLRLMNLGKADIDAALSLSENKGDVEIVSRPVIIASNNTEARFLVGSQRPFVQVSRSLPTDAPQRDQVIQYRDVGTKLTVRPTINQDGYVSLTIQQEINAATGEVAFDAPVISTREATTQILVRDGQTIVIGGLNDRQRDRNSSGIPLLSGIPIIGGLFGSSSRHTSVTELYLFLTPRILRTDVDVDSVTAPREARLGGAAEGNQNPQ